MSNASENRVIPSYDWCIVDNHGQKYRLPKTMIFLGHEECDFVIQSNSVDKRHAVVTFDHYVNKFKIKDLSTIYGTFINGHRIPEQEYVTLEEHDSIRLGLAPLLYYIEQMDKNSPDIANDLNPSGKIAIWPSEELLKIAELELAYDDEAYEYYEYALASFKKDNRLTPLNFDDPSNLPQTYNEDGYNGHALDDPNHTWQRKQRPKSWTSPSTYSAQSPESVEERKRSSYHLESNVDMEHHYFDPISPSLLKSSHSVMMDLPNSAIDSSRTNYVSMDNLPAYQRIPDAAGCEGQLRKSPHPPHSSQSHSQADLTSGKNSSDNSNYRSTRNDLTTVKKGTPLYGQPAWWGEPDDPEDEPAASSKKGSEKSESSNSSKYGNVLANAANDISQQLEKYKNDPKYACRYMEISHRDIESESMILCRRSLSSSISKDSLISPDSRKGSLEIISDIGKKQPSSERELSVEKSEANSKIVDGGGTAFTVELGDMKPRKWNASGSLSEFMPSKIRRSFRERALKQSTKDGTPPKTVAEGDSPEGKNEEVEFVREKAKSKNSSKSNHSSEEEEIQIKTKKDISPGNKNGQVPFPQPKGATQNEEYTPPTCSGGASFLINKMFQGSASSGVSPSGSNSNIGFEDQKTELDLYSEAREYSKKIFEDSQQQGPEAKELNIQEFSGDAPLEISEEKAASETGTYTIEGDVEAKEEEIARKRIDNVFGVGQDIQRPVINANSQILDKFMDDDDTDMYPNDNLSVDDLKCYVNNIEDFEKETPEKLSIDEEKNLSPETTQTPISDTTVQSSGKTSVDMDYRTHSESAGSSPLISKPPIGSARKRAGTGRKLPSLPPDNNSRPSSTSSKSQQQSQISATGTPPYSKKNEKLNNNNNTAAETRKLKSFTHSSQGSKSQRTKLEPDTDTNILLKDTEIAMAALEARVTSNNLTGTDDSESDISSSTNPREGMFRSRNRSTGERPGSRKSSLSDSSKVSSKSLLMKDRSPQIQRNYSKNSEKGSVSSDVTSESEALETLSNTSDFSLDCVSDNEAFIRHGSKGKGGISMTRPNRAFQLRQAKARGTEAADKPPPHSGGSSQVPSVVSKSSAGKVKRVNSVNLSSDRRSDSRRDSNPTLKSNESLKVGSGSNFMRADGGRYSLRATRSASTSSATKPNLDYHTRSDSKTSKSQLKSAHSTPGLNIISLSSKSLSQPVSRSNSPRTSDKTSSKKRKEFSQRKQKSSSSNPPSAAPTNSKTSISHSSVADSSKSLANSRLVRSASLELSKSKNSGVQTNKSSSKSYKDVSSLGEDNIKYGFVPYCGYKLSRSGLEQDEYDFTDEERMQLPKSIQDVCKGSLAGFTCQSAFVPASKRKPYDTIQSTLNHLQSSCLNSSSLKKKRELVSLRQGSVPWIVALSPVHLFNMLGSQPSLDMIHNGTSCDRIIVSSIYRLSVKLKTATDRTVQRLREYDKTSPMPFLSDDFMDQDSGEMPAWTSANRELAAILCNLRHIEHRIRVIDQALFPDKESLEIDGLSHQRKEKEKKLHYLQEIERIRTEIAGFQPIDNPEEKLWKDNDRKMDGCSNYSAEEELF